MFVWKRPKIKEKQAGLAHLKKQCLTITTKLFAQLWPNMTPSSLCNLIRYSTAQTDSNASRWHCHRVIVWNVNNNKKHLLCGSSMPDPKNTGSFLRKFWVIFRPFQSIEICAKFLLTSSKFFTSNNGPKLLWRSDLNLNFHIDLFALRD